jgi:integrating conjugative element membrane protein (TIGR03747 family)
MKDAASTAQREQNQRQGLIVGTITLPFRLLGVLIGSLLFSIVVECVGMHLFWKDQGWRHSQQMLQYELGHLSNHFTRSVVVQEPGRTAHELVDTGYEWVFVRSGLAGAHEPDRRARPCAQPGRARRRATSATTSARSMSGPRAT